jgi:hypothetical protein
LTCVIVPKIDCFEKFVLVFDALQITHFLEMFYSKELNAIAEREESTVETSANLYSIDTELQFTDNTSLRIGSVFSEEFAEFGLHYVDQLLKRPPLCWEWLMPLVSSDGIILCTLINREGAVILEIPSSRLDSSEQDASYHLFACPNTRALMQEKAVKLVRSIKIEDNLDEKAKESGAGIDHDKYLHQDSCCQHVFTQERVGRRINVILMPILSGPMNVALCLIIYFLSLQSELPVAAESSLRNAHLGLDEGLDNSMMDYGSSCSSSPVVTAEGACPTGPIVLQLRPLFNADSLWRTGMRESAFRIVSAAVNCIASSFPRKNAVLDPSSATVSSPPAAFRPSMQPPADPGPPPPSHRAPLELSALEPAPPSRPKGSAHSRHGRRNFFRQADERDVADPLSGEPPHPPAREASRRGGAGKVDVPVRREVCGAQRDCVTRATGTVRPRPAGPVAPACACWPLARGAVLAPLALAPPTLRPAASISLLRQRIRSVVRASFAQLHVCCTPPSRTHFFGRLSLPRPSSAPALPAPPYPRPGRRVLRRHRHPRAPLATRRPFCWGIRVRAGRARGWASPMRAGRSGGGPRTSGERSSAGWRRWASSPPASPTGRAATAIRRQRRRTGRRSTCSRSSRETRRAQPAVAAREPVGGQEKPGVARWKGAGKTAATMKRRGGEVGAGRGGGARGAGERAPPRARTRRRASRRASPVRRRQTKETALPEPGTSARGALAHPKSC